MKVIDREPWPPYLALTSLIPIALGLVNQKIKINDFNSLFWITFIVALIFLALYINAIYACGKKHDYISQIKPKADKYDELISSSEHSFAIENSNRINSHATDEYQGKHSKTTIDQN